MPIADLLPDNWTLVHTVSLPPRSGELTPFGGLPLSEPARRFLEAEYPQGIYRHQYEAIAAYLGGSDVCLATGTASGKTLAFHVAAIDELARNASSRVLAIYPQRALGNEQEERWKTGLAAAGLEGVVSRIDGSVSTASRGGLLERSRLIVMTPDVLHAWFMSHLSEKPVRAFLAGLRLVVLDEVHTYTGVLGTNAAYLMRRLQYAVCQCSSSLKVFAASATIRDPERHLEFLVGRPFSVIGSQSDSSPRQRLDIALVRPPHESDFLTGVTSLLRQMAQRSEHRFLAFVDSRKQTEQIASIAGRSSTPHAIEESDEEAFNPLEGAPILPYRSGYEEVDRRTIERRLSTGSLRGVVSTSALELGIDIPHLDVAVLIGVPRSSTSLSQRIGRIGRSAPGQVLIISTGDVYDEAVFRSPKELLRRPPAEGALYLENPRIQYIHALCIARVGGEHDQLADGPTINPECVQWPDGFLELCELERTGQIGPELQAMKAEAGEEPTYTFPLRDVESQFKVTFKSGPIENALGSLSFSQVLREGYPGAVYYYATQPYRVTSVSLRSRAIIVRKERRYTTNPTRLPTLMFPNHSAGNILRALEYGQLRLVESPMQIRESLLGFQERRGNTKESYAYPLTGKPQGVTYSAPRFTRNYFTTGVTLHWPALDVPGVDCDALGELLYEALLMVAPYERADVGFGVDKMRADGGIIRKSTPFIGIFDQTYGSLRLSGRLAQPEIFPLVVRQFQTLLEGSSDPRFEHTTRSAAAEMIASAELEPEGVFLDEGIVEIGPGANRVRVIKPSSKGLCVKNGNLEFHVERVFLHPKLGLSYSGHTHGAVLVAGQVELWPVEAIEPIVGESEFAFYNYDTGEVES